MKNAQDMRIAVVGAGVAGIVAAYLLQHRYQVSLYEKNHYLGGHTHTIVIKDGIDAGAAVDTGFIVFNEKTYPNFIAFLTQLGIARQKSPMSFSYYNEKSGLQYGSHNINTFFAQRINILRPSFWRMFLGILAFNRITPRLLEEGRLSGFTMGEYLRAHRFNTEFVEHYLLPISAAVWSTPDVQMLDFPMETFARFFANHGLFSIERHPQWFTVSGGSHAYVKAFLKGFGGKVQVGRAVQQIRRTPNGAVIKTKDGTEEAFDSVVIATHADEALSLLADPSPDEQELLSTWQYSQNRTILHTDTTFLPPNRRAWASWNYVRTADVESGHAASLTYYMNRLQNLKTTHHYCVTLNTDRQVAREHVISRMLYTHPVYTTDAFATQERLRAINGMRGTFFCGSYLGYGFHEDAVRSGIEVARRFGIEL